MVHRAATVRLRNLRIPPDGSLSDNYRARPWPRVQSSIVGRSSPNHEGFGGAMARPL